LLFSFPGGSFWAKAEVAETNRRTSKRKRILESGIFDTDAGCYFAKSQL